MARPTKDQIPLFEVGEREKVVTYCPSSGERVEFRDTRIIDCPHCDERGMPLRGVKKEHGVTFGFIPKHRPYWRRSDVRTRRV